MSAVAKWTPVVAALLLVLLATSTGWIGCRGGTSTQPPIHPNLNMDNVQRFDPQEPSPFHEDGRAMRRPVPGTVAVGHLRADTHFYEGRLQGELVNELPSQLTLSRELLERGQDRFEIFCTPCHGPAGYSDGVVIERGMLQPPSFHEERLRHEPLGHLYDVITNGVRNMSPYRSQLSVEDRWAVAAFVRALQASQVAVNQE